MLHREVAHAFGEHVKSSVKGGLALRRSHQIDVASKHGSASMSLTYVGSRTEGDLTGTPMGDVRDALVGYVQSGRNSQQQIQNGVITDKTMAFDVTLGCHTGRLNVTYDSAHDLYFVEWGLQEPQDGQGRLKFCPSYFSKAGFEHTIDGWKHYARKKVSREDIHRAIWFMMFSLENMKNVDISSPVFDQSALYRLFETWYEGHAGKPARSSGLSDHAAEVFGRVPKWKPAQKKICSLMLEDPHVFRIAEIEASAMGSSSNNTVFHAFAVFIADHAGELLKSSCSPERMASLYRTVAEVYFEGVQPLVLSELKELGIERTPSGPNAARVTEASKEEADRIRGVSGPDEASQRLKAGSARAQLQGPIFQRTR